MKKKYWYFLILVVQTVICYFAFTYHFHNGFDSSFCNYGDGMKNNFTLVSFVQEPIGEKGIFHFDFFQYPYGDYVYTADNTPIYALTMRWIHHYLFPVAQLTIPIFNMLLIGNFLLCGLLLFYFGKRFIKNRYWLFGLAVLLPFFLEQSLRLPRGHYNLSLSAIFAFSFILCQWYADRILAGRSVWKLLLAMFLMAIVGFLIHGYYLPILTILFGMFLFVFHFKSIFSRSRWSAIFKPIGLVAAIGLSSLFIMKMTDGFFDIRQKHAQGYDLKDQKLSPSYLFQSYPFNSIQFPLRTTDSGSFSEPHMYLGHSFWALFILSLLLALLYTSFRRALFDAFKSVRSNYLLGGLTVTALVLFAISCGEYFFSHNIQLSVTPLLQLGGVEWTFALIVAVGAVAMSALALLWIIIISVIEFQRHRDWSRKDKIQLLVIVLIIAWIVVFYFTNIIQFKHVPNLLNPFFYLRMVTRIVEQFRSIARFAWPFVLFIPILAVHVYARASSALPKGIRLSVALIVCALGISQLVDWVSYTHAKANRTNLFSVTSLQSIPAINDQDYAAILPFPFFMVGSEDYNVTIDDFDDFSTWLFQFSYKNKLPLMASKLSRTPAVFSENIMDILLNKEAENPILDLIKNKSILVIVSKEFMDQKSDEVLANVRYPDIQQKAFEANKAQFDFIKNPDLKWIKTEGIYDFYEWKVK